MNRIAKVSFLLGSKFELPDGLDHLGPGSTYTSNSEWLDRPKKDGF
jgi:hypothetical protein